MNFGEMFKTQLNAMVYARCMWDTEGKNPMQLMKAHLTIISASTKVRYDLCVYESDTVAFEKVRIPEANGKKMFELDRETYDRIAAGHFFFLQIVSENRPMVPNFVFSTLEEAQRFMANYQRDTRGLDVMFKHLDPQEAAKLPPQAAVTPSAEQPAQSAEKAEQEPAPASDGAAAQRPAMRQAPINMLAYDRFCLDTEGIDKRSLVRFRYAFVSPVTKGVYETYVLQSRSKAYSAIVIPENNGRPVVEVPQAAYDSIASEEFYFVEVVNDGHTLVPNVLFATVDDAKRYLYNYKMDTRGLDVMFRKLTAEEAGKMERQPSLDAPAESRQAEAEQSAEEDTAASAEEAVEEEAAAPAEEESAAPEERQAEPVETPQTETATEAAAQEAGPAESEEPAAAEQPAAGQTAYSTAASAEEAPTEAASEQETQVSEEPQAEPVETPQPAEEAPQEAVQAEERPEPPQAEPVAEEPAAEQPKAEQPAEEPVSRARVSRAEAVTPPISMAVYSRFCMDLTATAKEDLIRHTAYLASTYSDTRYEVNVYLGKSLPYDEVKIPEINGKKLFDLPREDYEKLCEMRFYFIEVTSDGQTTVLNKIFADLDTAKRYVAMYEDDIRELDVMFRRITPADAAKYGKVPGQIVEAEEEEAEETPEVQAEEEAPIAAEESDETLDEERIETKTYIDENGDEVEEQTVVRTRTLFEDDDEAEEEEYVEEEYADEEYADEEYDESYEEEAEAGEDVEFVDEGEEEYAEEAEEYAEEEEAAYDEEGEYVEEEYAEETEDEEAAYAEETDGAEAEESQEAEEKPEEKVSKVARVADDKVYLDRKADGNGNVIYNQPIYAKEVYIQFPQGVTTLTSPLASGYTGDPLAEMNYKEEFNEVDFTRYMEQVERRMGELSEPEDLADDAYDFETEGLFARAAQDDFAAGSDLFAGSGREYERYFGLDDGSDELEDIFGDLLRDKKRRTAKDDYDEVMELFRTGSDDTGFKDLF